MVPESSRTEEDWSICEAVLTISSDVNAPLCSGFLQLPLDGSWKTVMARAGTALHDLCVRLRVLSAHFVILIPLQPPAAQQCHRQAFRQQTMGLISGAGADMPTLPRLRDTTCS